MYVAGADGYLYAFNESSLSLKWKSVIAIPSTKTSNYFDWSSPTVANGKVYVGVSSGCDNPLNPRRRDRLRPGQGEEARRVLHGTQGHCRRLVWSSVAVGPGGYVYATTGERADQRAAVSNSESIVKLDPDTLKLLGHYQVPASEVTSDSDFGGSPTIFGRYVGACNKNGVYYAVNQSTMTLVWKKRIGTAAVPCLAPAVYNGKDLFIGGPATTDQGQAIPRLGPGTSPF